jgi:hypothetical protein
MWDAWGGASGVNWAIAKLKQIDRKKKMEEVMKKGMENLVQRGAFKKAKAMEQAGVMRDVSLLQVGEAKGHGVYVDEKSLETAQDVITEKVPAFLTHNGAMNDDRLLKQIGFFEGFYISENRLLAKRFIALDSFREDEPEKFNRLFDIASEIPETFGISLVFTHTLAWVLKNGKELAVQGDQIPSDAVRDIPSVRFVEIESADFVDAPASNDRGLFNQHNQTIEMDKEKLEEVEEVEETPIALAEDEESEESEETEETEEETEAEEKDKTKADYSDMDTALGLISELSDKVNAIAEQMDSMSEAYAELSSKHDTLLKISKLGLSQSVKPAKFSGEAKVKKSVKEQIMALSGPELQTFLRENRSELNSALRQR